MFDHLDKRLWVLAASILLLVAVPLWLLWPDQEPIPAADWVAPTPLKVVGPRSSGMAERKLFLEKAAQGGQAAQQASPPRLLGIAMRLRGKGVAVVKLSSGETENLYVGDEADGWKLAALTPKTATFSNTSGSVTVSLDFSNKDAQPTAAAPQSPQSQRTSR